MSATYNWSYKNGITNKYGLTVPSTANDSTRPTSWAYIAPWGNDITGNGSRQLPFKTMTKGYAIAGINCFLVLASGVYREALGSVSGVSYVGDGNVIIDNTIVALYVQSFGTVPGIYNIKVTGCTYWTNGGAIALAKDCVFDGVAPANLGGSYFLNSAIGCTFINCPSFSTSFPGAGGSFKSFVNNTFYKCNISIAGNQIFSYVDNIFHTCNICFTNSPYYVDYTIFYQCYFRFNASFTTSNVYYPSAVPTGYVSYTTIASLQAANTAAFGTPTRNMPYSDITDPLFNNLAIFDFTLAFNSSGRNKSYSGGYIGAFSFASKIAARASALTSGFDNASASNLTIADDSITLTSTASTASIESKPIANLTGRIIKRLPVWRINADRNGQFVSTVLNLSGSTLSPGAVPINTPYVVEIGSITYNSAIYAIGDRFTSASSSLSFTTSTGGVIREILQAPSKETVEGRFNDGLTATMTNSGTIVSGTWYYVFSGSATYNSNTYATGEFFKGVGGVTSFTGTAVLQPTFDGTETYFPFQIGQEMTTNNTGNVGAGAILRGNAASDFDFTAANIFNVTKKFIQLRFGIQVANLSP